MVKAIAAALVLVSVGAFAGRPTWKLLDSGSENGAHYRIYGANPRHMVNGKTGQITIDVAFVFLGVGSKVKTQSYDCVIWAFADANGKWTMAAPGSNADYTMNVFCPATSR